MVGGGRWTPPLDCLPEFTRSSHDSSARCNPPMPATGGSLRRSASLETSVIPSVPPLHPFVRKKTCHARANFEFRSVMKQSRADICDIWLEGGKKGDKSTEAGNLEVDVIFVFRQRMERWIGRRDGD